MDTPLTTDQSSQSTSSEDHRDLLYCDSPCFARYHTCRTCADLIDREYQAVATLTVGVEGGNWRRVIHYHFTCWNRDMLPVLSVLADEEEDLPTE